MQVTHPDLTAGVLSSFHYTDDDSCSEGRENGIAAFYDYAVISGIMKCKGKKRLYMLFHICCRFTRSAKKPFLCISSS
jgi:hypothetical protein